MPTVTRRIQIIWQCLFVLLGTSWLLAPALDRQLSGRTSLISQFESAGQPYGWIFRLCDIAAAFLLLALITVLYRRKPKSWPVLLLLIIGWGMLVDPIFAVSCQIHGAICDERWTAGSFVHGVESCVTAGAILVLSIYDARVRRHLLSGIFVAAQILYGLLIPLNVIGHLHANTLAQNLYQYTAIIWLAWFLKNYVFAEAISDHRQAALPVYSLRWAAIIRYGAAGWIGINGLLAMVISLPHIHLFGRAHELYFGHDTAWLAQHGVIVGVALLYLSRHLARGELRARQIVLTILALETVKYAVITPDWRLALLYNASFALLFAVESEFRRGTLPMTWRVRLNDLAYLSALLAAAALIAWLVLVRDDRTASIANHAYQHFADYALHSDRIHRTHRESVLLADTATAFFGAAAAAMLWVMFKPYRLVPGSEIDNSLVITALRRFSASSEDYFKMWPADKQYFWDANKTGFIAYRSVGTFVYALADPITDGTAAQAALVAEFVTWCRARRLKLCFLAVPDGSRQLYPGLTSLQIGAGALVDCRRFLNTTSKDKWWRWKLNRARKAGYNYAVSQPPHAAVFLERLRPVSDDWLAANHHQERGFALGYFDEAYLDECRIHYLEDDRGSVVAFTNELPLFQDHGTASIDLIRYRQDASDAMPFVFYSVIESLAASGCQKFDLGFVPFAGTTGPLHAVAKAVSARRFSSQGLRQFKNKFDPDWENMYLMYDGDLGDLAIITLNVEAAMSVLPPAATDATSQGSF